MAPRPRNAARQGNGLGPAVRHLSVFGHGRHPVFGRVRQPQGQCSRGDRAAGDRIRRRCVPNGCPPALAWLGSRASFYPAPDPGTH